MVSLYTGIIFNQSQDVILSNSVIVRKPCTQKNVVKFLVKYDLTIRLFLQENLISSQKLAANNFSMLSI